ncbi:CBO0543 family protein [Clostridium fungisolvens]|uniref:Uncharacterized protein n=1 Tax=Clostridium fungisolvens TaxID=1604897 RepID=A0A6V8SCF5_9CLOT|nr:CBO0543 family protein [Clostridium fungisolvens]GFP74740.1 hypothetical protein bsdtw1_00795 [Clostridium fungisolvens]
MNSSRELLHEKVLELKRTELDLSLQHWYNYELFTWQWWIKFTYLIIPIFLFYKLLDRKRSFEILTYGLMISLMATIIDIIGCDFILWNYKIRLLPVGFFLIHDVIFIPIVSMLIFQYNSSWKAFITANIILSAIGAYIEEPIAVLINIYEPIAWKHTYSFFLFFAMTVICKYITIRLSRKKDL